MTYDELAALVAEDEDLDAMAEDELERITELHALDREDFWVWGPGPFGDSAGAA